MTWIPTIDWGSQPFKWMRDITDPYLDLFRRFIPPAGGIDFSPIIAIIALNVIQIVVVNIFAGIFG